MTYPELQIQLDLNADNRVNVLNSIDNNIDTCRLTRYGDLFVDSGDGQCYLFDENGQEDDINKVKNIGDWAFYNCISLTSIKIPNSVKRIGAGAFENCRSLTNIEIPNSIKFIGYDAFIGCTSLKEVVFNGKTIDKVKAIAWYPWGIKDKSVIKYKSFK